MLKHQHRLAWMALVLSSNNRCDYGLPMRLIQIARRKAIDALFNESFSNSWKYVFLPRIRNILGERPMEDDLIKLGENLSSIFTNSNVNNQHIP